MRSKIFITIIIVFGMLAIIGVVSLPYFYNISDNYKAIIPLASILLGIIPTIVINAFNEVHKLNFEKNKRIEELRHNKYVKREKIYNDLIINIQGFMLLGGSVEKKIMFIDTYRIAWLYCPDEIIKKISSVRLSNFNFVVVH